jgi:hypothetical protein
VVLHDNSVPIAYFPLHDPPGAQQPLNLGARMQSATVEGGVTFTGGSAQFDGTGTIDLGAGYDFQAMAAFMIEAWVQTSPTSSQTSSQVLLSDATPGLNPLVQGYQVVLLGDGTGQFQRGAGIASCGAGFTYPRGQGFYLVVLYGPEDGPGEFNAQVYVDGQVVTPDGNCTTVDPSLSQTSHLVIGADANGANHFSGVLSELAVYDTLLNPNQIAAHQAAGKSGP